MKAGILMAVSAIAMFLAVFQAFYGMTYYSDKSPSLTFIVTLVAWVLIGVVTSIFI